MLVQEVIDKILGVLNVSSVTNSGLVRQWDEEDPPELETVARVVTVTSEPQQDQAVPYARVTATDSAVLDGEPYGYDYQPQGRRIRVIVNVFSDWDKEARAVAAAVEALLVHRQIETDEFRGWSWMEEPIRFYQDNTADPNQIYEVAALAFRVTLQAKG